MTLHTFIALQMEYLPHTGSCIMQSTAFEIVQQYDIVEEWVKTWHMRDTAVFSALY